MSSINKKIIIDVRFLGTPTGIGRYAERLILELENLIEAKHRTENKAENGENSEVEFIILVSKDGWEKWEPKSLFEPEAPRALQAQHRAQIRKKLVDARWYTVQEQLALWRALREEKPYLVHFPHWNICYFWRGPFVVTIHDLILLEYPTHRASKLGAILYFIKYKFLFPLILRKAIYGSRKIIVPSNYTKQSILKHFPAIDAGKIEVIYEGVSYPHLNSPPHRGVEKDGKSVAITYNLSPRGGIPFAGQPTTYLLYVGNALPHKNLEFLVRVFKRLKEQPMVKPEVLSTTPEAPPFGPEAPWALRAQHAPRDQDRLKLILVGESNYFYDRLKKYVKELGVEKDVIFTGRVSDEELAELYKNAAAYIFPSLLEGFGLSPLEAMAAGIPVVAANSSCLPEILGEAALYLDPRDENDTIDKISSILMDERLRVELVNKGHEQVKKYNWGRMAEQVVEVYRSSIYQSLASEDIKIVTLRSQWHL